MQPVCAGPWMQRLVNERRATKRGEAERNPNQNRTLDRFA
jgi:hypothetical protein